MRGLTYALYCFRKSIFLQNVLLNRFNNFILFLNTVWQDH